MDRSKLKEQALLQRVTELENQVADLRVELHVQEQSRISLTNELTSLREGLEQTKEENTSEVVLPEEE